MRMDVEGVKEHSVDMLCEFWDESGYIVQLLVECKHRSPEKRLLLLHDPNMDWSPITLGGTVHCYDEFVPFHVKGNCFVDLEWKYPIVYKGVELHSGDAVEADFRRAIQQLRYATPTAVLRALEIGNCMAILRTPMFCITQRS
jgi:hypothetical protein